MIWERGVLVSHVHMYVKQKPSSAGLNRKGEMFLRIWDPSGPKAEVQQGPMKVLKLLSLSAYFIICPLPADGFVFSFFPQVFMSSHVQKRSNYLVSSISVFLCPSLSVSISSLIHPIITLFALC